MRQLGFSAVYILIALAFGGCQGPAVLPPDIAGTWQAYDSPWKIVLSPDGKLASAVIPVGVVEVRPNKTTRVEMKDGSVSTFRAGDCTVEYTSETRELYVAVRVPEIHVVFVDNQLDGKVDYFLFGKVSENGQIWESDVVRVFDYGPRFPQDPNDLLAARLIFEKVETKAQGRTNNHNH